MVLLVEDEKRMQEIVSDYFKAKGCQVICANNGLEALELLAERNFDLILLDIMMPKLDGFSVCRQIRKTKEVPIIFITAKVEEEEALHGYALGADDYVTKPFSLSVLYAKTMALIKRNQGKVIEEKLWAHEICVDCRTHEVRVEGQLIKLEPMTYRLLVYLMQHKNQVLTREQILMKLWGYDFEGNDRVIDTHMKKLRKTLGKSGKFIKTVIKVGYQLEVRDE